jgi:ech hydrogenase subunit B
MVLAEIAVLLIGPLLVGLSMGLDRKLTARLQNRRGPPLLQPFYDIAKLLSKRPQMLGDLQGLFALFCVAFQAVAF